MAMRSLASMLKSVPRRVVALREKMRSESFLDEARLREAHESIRPLLEESRRRTQVELRNYRRKAWTKAIVGYGFVGYLLSGAFSSPNKN